MVSEVKRPALWSRLLLIVLGLCLPLLGLEVAVRWLGLAPSPQPNPSIWTPHPLFGWWHIPYSGGTFRSDFNEFEAEVRINARSLRDREIGYDNSEAAFRILSLADSFGEAVQVDLEETYHKQLEKLLADSMDQPVEVINGGVGGWGTDQEAIFYLAEGFRYEPDIVLLSFFVRNDAVNNYGPLEIARNGGTQQKQFFHLSPTGELIPPPLESETVQPESDPTRMREGGDQPLPDLESGPRLLSLSDRLWRMSALYRFIVPYLRDVPWLVQKLGPTGILGGEAVIRAKHPTMPIPFKVYQSPPDEQFEAAWQITEAILVRFQEEVHKRGAKLIVVLIAAPEQLYPTEWEQFLARQPEMQTATWDLESPNRRLTTFLTEQNIPHLDLLPLFRAAAMETDTPPLHFRYDQHWTPEGHRLAAEAIHQFLLSQ